VRLPEDTDTVGRIESILDQLEAALELPPLETSTPPPPEGRP